MAAALKGAACDVEGLRRMRCMCGVSGFRFGLSM